MVVDNEFELEDNSFDKISCASRFLIMLGLLSLLETFDLRLWLTVDPCATAKMM